MSRPAYPKLSTGNKGATHPGQSTSGGNGVSLASSPTSSSRRPSLALDYTSTRKRLPGTRFPGDSPPDKRPRSDWEYDRYAAQARPAAPFSPPPSRHNSIAGVHAPVPTGPSNRIKDGLRVDPPRPPKDKDDRRDSLGRRPLSGARSHHVNSPSSMMHGEAQTSGSGGSTPQHVAPPANMFPATSIPTGLDGTRFPTQTFASLVNLANAEANNSRLKQNDLIKGSASGTINSLRALKEKKRAVAVAELESSKRQVGHALSSQLVRAGKEANDNQSTTDRLQADLKSMQDEIGALRNERKSMQSRLDELEKLQTVPEELASLSQQLKELENVPQQLRTLEQASKSHESLQNSLTELGTWRRSLPDPMTQSQVHSLVAGQKQSIMKDVATVKTSLEGRINEAIKSNVQSPSLNEDLARLLEFKQQTEEQDYLNQMRTLEERIKDVKGHQLKTHDGLDELKSSLDKSNDRQEERLKRHEVDARKKLNDDYIDVTNDIRAELKQQLVHIRAINDHVDKTIATSAERTTSHTATVHGEVAQVSSEIADLTKKSADQISDLKAWVIREYQTKTPSIGAGEPKHTANLEGIVLELRTMHANTEALSNRMDDRDETLQTLFNFMETSKHDLPHTFQALLKPFGSRMHALETEVAAWREQQPEQRSRVSTPQPIFTAAEGQQVQHLIKDYKELTQSSTSLLKWSSTVDDQTRAMSATIQRLDPQIDILQSALRSLEDRYSNITTDTLHQQMVHWITQNYPAAPDFLNQLKVVQQELNFIKDFTNKMSWLPHHAQSLYHLAQNSQQIDNVVQNAAALHDQRQNLQKALKDSEMATFRINEQASTIETLQRSLRVSDEAIFDLRTYQNSTSKNFQEERKNCDQSYTTISERISAEHEARINAHSSIPAVVQDVVAHMDRSDVHATKDSKNLQELRNAVSNFEDIDHAQINQFLGTLPQIFKSITEMQKVVTDINANMQGGGLKFKFNFDFNNPLLPTEKGKKKH